MIWRSAVVFTCCLLSCAATAAGAGYHAIYKLAHGPLTVGEMVRTFELEADGSYRFESQLRSTGLAAMVRPDQLMETSSGVFEAGKFYPDRYTYVRKNKKKPREVTMHFDRRAAQIETIYNGAISTSPLTENVLDKLIYQAALMYDLGNGAAAANYRISDRGKEKLYQPIIGEHTVIETRAGRFDTIKVTRDGSKGKRRTVFWCAPELGYLPVRVAHREKDGSETTVSLTKYTPINPAVADTNIP